MLSAKVIITDSGGIQEETSILRIPCLTLRDNTERPITVTQGSNTLIRRDWGLFHRCIERIDQGTYLKKRKPIPRWDGHTARRILALCANHNFKI